MRDFLKKYALVLLIGGIFEAVAVSLWLTKHNLFYLFNFSYIGISLSFGIFLLGRKYPMPAVWYSFWVGLYMLVYLGFINRENMQIEGFLVLLVHRCFRGGYHSLCRGKNLRAADFWKGLLRLCLLDCHGFGFSTL